MYHGIPDAVRDLCHQDVPEPSGTSDPSGDPDRTVGRRYRGMGQRFLRSEIPVASLHRNSGYPVDFNPFNTALVCAAVRARLKYSTRHGKPFRRSRKV